jgi:hypothetical protein
VKEWVLVIRVVKCPLQKVIAGIKNFTEKPFKIPIKRNLRNIKCTIIVGTIFKINKHKFRFRVRFIVGATFSHVLQNTVLIVNQYWTRTFWTRFVSQ